MGGCVASCMERKDQGQWIEDRATTRVRKMKGFSRELEGFRVPGKFSAIRRSPSMVGLEGSAWQRNLIGDYGNLTQMLAAAVKQRENQVAMSYRRTVEIKKEDVEGKMLEVTYLADVEHLTYAEMWTKMKNFAKGLQSLGLPAGAKVGIYEETCAEWMIACYGVWLAGMVGVTVYANLGEDALIYAMREAQVSAIVCNHSAMNNLREICRTAEIECPRVIYIGGESSIAGARLSDDAVSFDSLVNRGDRDRKALGDLTVPTVADPEEHALIMYTSGTTGDPKGVIMSHGNILSTVESFSRRLSDILGKESDVQESIVAYLPLAHCMELALENLCLHMGIRIGYGHPRTLTDKTAKSATTGKPCGDLALFRPTFFAGVPRIFDTIKKVVEAKLPPPGSLKRKVYDTAYASRKAAIAEGKDSPYFNEKVFQTTRAIFGGRLRAIASGAAPLCAPLQEFMEVAFGVHVMQGYGLTETVAGCTIQRYGDTTQGSIGGLISGAEVRLRDVPDTNWNQMADPPAGEILIRGPCVTKGYYRQEKLTAEAYDEEGWFHTGDVGQFAPDGSLKIIGRVKALAKNCLGEYIAMEALEAIYALNPLVQPNGVCIIVNPAMPYIGAIVCTDEGKVRAFCRESGRQFPGSENWQCMLEDEEFKKQALASLVKTAKENNRKPMEFLKSVALVADVWTPENNILTAAQKLKRREVDVRYAAEIKKLFAKGA